MKKPPPPNAKPATKAKPASQFNLSPVGVLARIPHDILAGVDRRVLREGLKSRNQALALAALEYGDFKPAERKALKDEFLDVVPSLGELVKTQAAEPPAPGSRLDKKSIGKSAGKPKPSKPPRKGAKPADDADDVVV